TAPVSFTVTVPANTPNNDTISIQFNPFGWTESIPMWPLGNRQWLFVLYSPLQLVSNVGYRFCRNDQCGLADDETSQGSAATGKIITPGKVAQNLQEEVKKWAWISNETLPTNVISAEIQPRGSSFIAGVELQPRYSPSWQPYMTNGFDHIKQMGANWVTLDPAWTATSINPPVIEAISGKNPYWQDLVQMVVWAQDKDLSIAVYPVLNYEPSEEQWWNSAVRDANWWASWFDRYRTFILQHADLAAQVKAGYLILGDPSVIPSMPNGKLLNGTSSKPPVDAEKQWRNLIADVRSRYHGKIAWVLPYNGNTISTPAFINDVDEIYVLWTAALTTSATPQPEALAAEMGRLLDQDILKLKEKLKKGVLLGINYPAVGGAARGCVRQGTLCIPFDNLTFDFPTPITPNLGEQSTLYNAVLVALNSRKWIDGIFSRGYYPPAAVQDFSTSVHGKPAADVLWYWYPKLLGSPN
ncbi:MAG: hypothetical protein Q7U74_06225, partial [Saprospiraceae bacterium]|nr:hypothetical protein [Saprospiraceae bacterium]